MSLKSSTVHRNLDAKLKIAGMEAHDLLFILLFASIMNLIFGKTALSFFVVFVLPAFLTAILFFAKRNKPDQYLVHLLRYHLSPGFYSAATSESARLDRMCGRIDEG